MNAIKMKGGEGNLGTGSSSLPADLMEKVRATMSAKLGTTNSTSSTEVDATTKNKLALLEMIPEDVLKTLAMKYGHETVAKSLVKEAGEGKTEDERLADVLANIDNDVPLQSNSTAVTSDTNELTQAAQKGNLIQQSTGQTIIKANKKEDTIMSKEKSSDKLTDAIMNVVAALLKKKGQTILENTKNPKPVKDAPAQSSVTQPVTVEQTETSTPAGEAASAGDKKAQYQPAAVTTPPVQEGVQEPVLEEQTEVSTDKTEAENAGTPNETSKKKEAFVERRGEGATKNPAPVKDAPTQRNVTPPKEEVQTETITSDYQAANAGEVKATKRKAIDAVPEPKLNVTKVKEDVKPSSVTQPVVEVQKNLSKTNDAVVVTEDVGSSNLPGARGTTAPIVEDQKTTITEKGLADKTYTAKYVPAKEKLNSTWVAQADKKPIFSVTLKQAFGEGIDAITNWKKFSSLIYGQALETELNRSGALSVLKEWYGNGRYATMLKAQVEDTPPVLLTDASEKKISDEEGELSDNSLVSLLVDIIAPVASIKEDFDANQFSNDLKSLVSDEEGLGNFVGELEGKIKSLKEEKEKDIGVENAEDETLVDSTPQEESVQTNTIARKIKASSSKSFVDAYAGLFKNISGEDFVNKYTDALRDAESAIGDRDKKIATIGKNLKELAIKYNRMVAVSNKKVKARKVVILAASMVKKGMISSMEEATQAKSLMSKDMKTLNEYGELIANVKVASGGKFKVLGDNIITARDKDSGSELNPAGSTTPMQGLFTGAPKVDEKTAVDYKNKSNK